MRRLKGGDCAMRSAGVAAEGALVVFSYVFPLERILLSWDVELARPNRRESVFGRNRKGAGLTLQAWISLKK